MLAPDRDPHHIPVRCRPALELLRLLHRQQTRLASPRLSPELPLPLPQGYTGFLPGHQHHMAKTYGQVSKDALAERQANDDPLKWRKFVSYAEFTPPKTPAEGHFIPGYSGNVAGVYAENLYAATYGKMTLKAVNGDYPKGQVYDSKEQAALACSWVAASGSSAHTRTPAGLLPCSTVASYSACCLPMTDRLHAPPHPLPVQHEQQHPARCRRRPPWEAERHHCGRRVVVGRLAV